MAVINITDEIVVERIQVIIQNVLINRKLQFDKNTILPFIKDVLLKEKIDTSIMECSYFQILFLNTLDKLIENGVLYTVDGVFFPTDYIIFNDYVTEFSDLFYLIYDEEHQPIYFNLDTLERNNTLKRRDFLLTGGYDKLNDELLIPDVDLNEIVSLYKSFVSEGALKKDAINHILNYYDIQKLSPNDYVCNTVIIKNKNKDKSFTKKLKRDNI